MLDKEHDLFNNLHRHLFVSAYICVGDFCIIASSSKYLLKVAQSLSLPWLILVQGSFLDTIEKPGVFCSAFFFNLGTDPCQYFLSLMLKPQLVYAYSATKRVEVKQCDRSSTLIFVMCDWLHARMVYLG